ncbi:MAG: NUDIX hydrolase, partial [Actinomycetota bacterium]
MALIRHRITARVILQSKTGTFLMFFTHWDPESGLNPRWVIPGGGIEGNEPLALAASRELQEETGFW